jgi:hypothetical protein
MKPFFYTKLYDGKKHTIYYNEILSNLLR